MASRHLEVEKVKGIHPPQMMSSSFSDISVRLHPDLFVFELLA